MTTILDVSWIQIPVVEDQSGNLAFVENKLLPFDFKRVYYLFDVPYTAFRGGHSHKVQQEVLVAVSGSFEVILHDGKQQRRYFLNKPNMGLYLPKGIWRELENFSSGALCLVFASDCFDESDYIRDYQDFLNSKK